jgi:hypothetical protein
MKPPKPHPHLDAQYSVVAGNHGEFSVAVSIPGTEPTMVVGFADEAAAEAWIIRQKRRVLDRPFNRRRPGRQRVDGE